MATDFTDRRLCCSFRNRTAQSKPIQTGERVWLQANSGSNRLGFRGLFQDVDFVTIASQGDRRRQTTDNCTGDHDS